MKKWYQKTIAAFTAVTCLFGGGTVGLSQGILPQLQLTAKAETYIGESDGLQLEYADLDDGTVEITGFIDSTSTDIELPAVIDGKSVTSIGSRAFCKYDFENSSHLKSIIIPESVTSIKKQAFFACDNLTDITLPDSITSIEESVFSDCNNLTSIVIPNNVTSIGGNAFYNCSSLTSVVIPDSVTNIGSYAFSDCESLQSITIPENLKSIAYYTFENCSSLTSMKIPKNVEEIDFYAFEGCSNLSEFIVDSDNSSFTSEDGVLFDKNMETLLHCPAKKSGTYTVPNGIKSIGEYAFDSCESLTSIIISNSVTTIDDSAFYGCSNLTSVMIPKSVTSIEDCVVSSDRLNGLTDIYYEGTEDEWNQISIESSISPDITIHYNSEPITTTTTVTTSSPSTTTTTTTTKPVYDNIYGDINLDGVVDLTDAIMLNKQVAGVIMFTSVQQKNADCYRDGSIDDKDTTALMQFVISLIDTLPVEVEE